jgi:hypothetical protein
MFEKKLIFLKKNVWQIYECCCKKYLWRYNAIRLRKMYLLALSKSAGK